MELETLFRKIFIGLQVTLFKKYGVEVGKIVTKFPEKPKPRIGLASELRKAKKRTTLAVRLAPQFLQAA